MIIDVTQEDIDNGARKSCFFCPVSLALSRYFNEHIISVGTKIFSFRQKRNDVKRRSLHTPKDVQVFIRKFDAGVQVEPFSFFLEDFRV